MIIASRERVEQVLKRNAGMYEWWCMVAAHADMDGRPGPKVYTMQEAWWHREYTYTCSKCKKHVKLKNYSCGAGFPGTSGYVEVLDYSCGHQEVFDGTYVSP